MGEFQNVSLTTEWIICFSKCGFTRIFESNFDCRTFVIHKHMEYEDSAVEFGAEPFKFSVLILGTRK